MADTPQVVLFKGSKYRSSILLQNGKVAPPMTIKVAELAVAPAEDGTITGLIPESKETIVCKIDGKYHILAGTVKVEAGTTEINVRFMSSVNMKKAKTGGEVIAVPPVAKPGAPHTTRSFSNNQNNRPTQIHRTAGRGR